MPGFSLMFFLIGFIFLILFIYAITKNKNRNAVFFSFMCLAKAVYIFAYGFELNAKSIEEVIFFTKLGFFGLAFIPVLWFMFAYKFYFNKYACLKTTIAALIIPFITLFLSATNEYHHLVYTNFSVINYNGLLLAKVATGPWYYIFIFYSYILLISGILVFYLSWKKSRYNFNTQAFWMFIGSFLLCAISLIQFFGLSPMGIKTYPFGFLFAAASFVIALYKYEFL